MPSVPSAPSTPYLTRASSSTTNTPLLVSTALECPSQAHLQISESSQEQQLYIYVEDGVVFDKINVVSHQILPPNTARHKMSLIWKIHH